MEYDVVISSISGHLSAYVMIDNLIAIAELDIVNGHYWFSRLYVPPKLRCHGIANALVDAVIQKADEENIPIVCYVNAYGDMSEDDLIKFYKKHGLKDHESEPYGCLYREVSL